MTRTLHILTVIMALIADVALMPIPRHIEIHIAIAAILLLSFVIPFRLSISWRYFFITAIMLLLPVALWNYTAKDTSSIMNTLHYTAGIYFMALAIIMIYKKWGEGDPALTLAFILMVMIFSGFRDSRLSEVYKVCVGLEALLTVAFSMLHEHPVRKEERRRGAAYWKRLSVTVIILLVMSYGIAKFFVWTETKVNSLFMLTLDSLSFSPAFSSKTEIGSVYNLKGSQRIVLRIVSSAHPAYLVGKVFQSYSNRVWEAKRSSKIVYPVKPEVAQKVAGHFPEAEGSVFSLTKGSDPGTDADRATIFQTYYITALNTETVFAPRGSLFALITSEYIRIDGPGVIYTTLKGTSGEYHLACCPGEVVKADESSEDLSPYLELPPLSDRIRNLGGELIRKEDPPFTNAQILVDYFHGNFKYGPAPTAVGGKDVLDEFLFNTKQGHCEFFATSMTLLLRQSGIPARYINGFLVDEYNRMGGYYVVREKDAHAWVEAYIPGKGWVTFDPTPPNQGQADKSSLLPPFIRELYDVIKLKLHNIISRIMAGDIKGMFVFVILQIRDLVVWLAASPHRAGVAIILVLASVFLAVKRKTLFAKDRNNNNNRKSRLLLPPKVRELMKLASECEKLLARKKLKRHFSDSLLELSKQAGSLSLDPESLAMVQDFIREYCALRFGRDDIGDDDILRMKEKLQAIRSRLR